MEGREIKFRNLLLVITQILAVTILANAQARNYLLPESYEIRREFRNLIEGSNTDIEQQPVVYSDCFITGRQVKLQVLKSGDSYYFIFINEVIEKNRSDFPLVAPGSYIIKRNINSGIIEQIKIFLNNDEETFVRITARGDDSFLELFLFGSRLYKDVILPISVDNLTAEPFETIIILSDYIVNWDILNSSYNETENKNIMKVCFEIDQKLPLLKDSEDGAQDKNGDFVFINSMQDNPAKGFNCSGFAKWVSDGIYSAKTSRLMDVGNLKKKNYIDRRDTLSLLYEDFRDPLFGLDWTRNIAMTVHELDHPGNKVQLSDVDIREYPYEIYTPDIGYPVSSLKAVLYYLSVTDPGYIYLGSVNGDFGSKPVLRQHYHVAVFAPYIGRDGNFHPVLYETNKKTPIDDFVKRYKGESVHLVRIKAESNFSLPEIPPLLSE